jgi:AcrR family transcriptional regulator
MGFDRASLRQIAEDAGITRNAIVNYYSSKMELYGASLASIQEVVLEQILGDAGQEAGPVHRRIMAVFERAVQTQADDETLVRFFVTSTTDAIYHPSLRDQVVLPLISVREHIKALLDGARDDGEIDDGIDTEATAQVCADLLWGLAFDISLSSDDLRARRTLAALSQVVAAALSPVSQRIT